MYWNKYTHDEMKRIVFNALKDNSAYDSTEILGLPGTYLDRETFYDDAPFLKDAPFLSTLIANPNHIGCHTLTEQEHEDVFKGTQKIEVDLIRLCAEQIFKGDFNEQDGYVASGGTEANIQAIWIYRNYFIKEKHAFIDDIAVVYSEDSHYSMAKAANLLHLNSIVLKVDESTRMIKMSDLHEKIEAARMNGVKYFIIVMNLSTTMFGSVDDISAVSDYFNDLNLTFKLHIDAAFGGFVYPFTNPENDFNFQNPNVTSITIDGHKMLQSPYGTGIFLIRKGYMDYVCTDEAQYVPGKDYTLSGSRSGANAVSVWMILRTYGSDGWKMKMEQLTDKTSRLCSKLSDMNITFFRNPYLNIIAIRSNYISNALAKKYHLVADTYEHTPQWYKIVIMPHVKQGTLDAFVNDLQSELNLNQKLCI
ncbi:MAG: aspartate aminotransferase family protein [Bacteroidetes bacterium]|nr:aspartate aminotransferase family protein [Bacteroidota bacterium]